MFDWVIKIEKYKVRVGDTLWDIVNNITLKEIGNVVDVGKIVYNIMINNEISKNGIYVGQVINIPIYIPITKEFLHQKAKEE